MTRCPIMPPMPIPSAALRHLRPAALVLAAAASAIALYLFVRVTLLGQMPAFCGGGEGCEEVLTSRFSKVLFVPVSLPALAGYWAAAAGVAWAASADEAKRRRGALLAAAAGACLIAGAAWFVVLQATVIGHFCRWCLAAHGVGVLLGVCALASSFGVLSRRAVPAMLAGVLAVGVLAGAQWWGPAPKGPAPILATLPTGRDFDETRDGLRFVGVGNGSLRLSVSDEPHVGDASDKGGPVLVLAFDYACPRCRQTHAMARQFMADERKAGRSVVLLGLPLSIWQGDNPSVGATEEHFRHSGERARIVLAAARAKPACWDELDQWMFVGEPGKDFPRTPEAARAKAAELVGEQALADALADPRTEAAFRRNIDAVNAWRKADDRIQAIPVLASPGKPMLAGMVNDPQDIAEMLAGKK